MTLTQPDDAAQRAAIVAIRKALKVEGPWVGRVDVQLREDGYFVRLYPDPLMVKARALQQGLDDESVEAALRSARFQDALASALARVNATLEPSHQIKGYEAVQEGR